MITGVTMPVPAALAPLLGLFTIEMILCDLLVHLCIVSLYHQTYIYNECGAYREAVRRLMRSDCSTVGCKPIPLLHYSPPQQQRQATDETISQ